MLWDNPFVHWEDLLLSLLAKKVTGLYPGKISEAEGVLGRRRAQSEKTT